MRISGLSWCHKHCLQLCIGMIASEIHVAMRWIISFAPLISYGIMGILHKVIIALMPLADSQSFLYNTKLVII